MLQSFADSAAMLSTEFSSLLTQVFDLLAHDEAIDVRF
jgi:hypothetical protein